MRHATAVALNGIVLLGATALIVVALSERPARLAFRSQPATNSRTWSAVFDRGRRVELWAKGQSSAVSDVFQGPASLFLPDPPNATIWHFTDSGPSAIRVDRFSAAAVDETGNVITFSAWDRRIKVFSPPDYRLAGSFLSPVFVTQMLPMRDGLVIYSPYIDTLLAKLDRAGRVSQKVEWQTENNLRLFLCRFQTGGIVGDGHGGLFAVYPERFVLNHLDGHLHYISTISGGMMSPWRISSPPFPAELSPYDYTPQHEQWWNSYLHVFRIYRLASNILAVSLYRANGQAATDWFLNLYSTEGRALAEGLPVPYGQVLGAGGCRIWIGKHAALTERGAVEPQQLWEFHLRPDFCAATVKVR